MIRKDYTGWIGYDIYDPGNRFYANWGLGQYHPLTRPNHKGADYGTIGATGVGVAAAMEGKVDVIDNSDTYGMMVRVTTTMADGQVVVMDYGHIKARNGLVDGMTVKPGEIIGTVENAATLESGGGGLTIAASEFLPHLHVTITVNDVLQDPYTFNSWQEQEHFIGYDLQGNKLTAISSGNVHTIQAHTPTGVLQYREAEAPVVSADGCSIIGYERIWLDANSNTVMSTQLTADGRILMGTMGSGLALTHLHRYP